MGQGVAVYAALRLLLKAVPVGAPALRYRLSLTAMGGLLALFVSTWWAQLQQFSLPAQQVPAAGGNISFSILRATGNGTLVERVGAYPLLQVILPWLSVFYVAGLLLMLVRLSGGMVQLQRLRKYGNSEPEQWLSDAMAGLKARINYTGNVRLLLSARANVPMVIGFFKPVILMPVAALAQLSTQQVEAILLHEIAHIKRYDYLINMLQAVVETLLFFNPFIWLISAEIRREREHCCDDLVLACTQAPLPYASALTALASYGGTTSSLAVAATGNSHQLFNRIQRIMETKKSPFSYSRVVAALVIATAITGSLVWLSPSLAAGKKPRPDATHAAVASPEPAAVLTPDQQETNQLIGRMLGDRVIDENDGFTIEKKQQQLFINGKQQTDVVAQKYLANIKQEAIKVRVNSFKERLMQHPGAGLIQILAPVMSSSSCIDNSSNHKPGC